MFVRIYQYAPKVTAAQYNRTGSQETDNAQMRTTAATRSSHFRKPAIGRSNTMRSSLTVVIALSVFLLLLVQQDFPTTVSFLTSVSAPATDEGWANDHRLLTVSQMKKRWMLPCNYVHDGFYVGDSNEVLNQVHQSLLQLDDTAIPVLLEVGGHDGITKSLSLKSRVCLHVNTMLIEGSPPNHQVLRQTRSYDRVVHAALCDGENVTMQLHEGNSGQSKVMDAHGGKGLKNTVTVPCTSLDQELDKLRSLLPVDQQDKLVLLLLILDVEGHEASAVSTGLIRNHPQKLLLETKMMSNPHKKIIRQWVTQYQPQLQRRTSCTHNDACYQFDRLIDERPHQEQKALLYGARKETPADTYKTSEASKAYYFYGK